MRETRISMASNTSWIRSVISAARFTFSSESLPPEEPVVSPGYVVPLGHKEPQPESLSSPWRVLAGCITSFSSSACIAAGVGGVGDRVWDKRGDGQCDAKEQEQGEKEAHVGNVRRNAVFLPSYCSFSLHQL